MTFPVDISRLLALRSKVSDQVLLDYLEVLELIRVPALGPAAAAAQLIERWNCSSVVTAMRLRQLIAAGLAYKTQDGRINLCALPPA
jgi:hypothetical protein